MIYSYVFREHCNDFLPGRKCDHSAWSLCKLNFRTAEPSLRLVCRQMKAEYDDSLSRCPQNNTLVIKDKHLYNMVKAEDIPSSASRCTRLTIESAPFCCENEEQLEDEGGDGPCDEGLAANCYSLVHLRTQMRNNEELLRHFPTIQSTTIQLSIEEPTYCLKHIVEEATRFPMLTCLDVIDSRDDAKSWHDVPTYFARWTRERGFVVNKTELDECWEVIEEGDIQNQVPEKRKASADNTQRIMEGILLEHQESERNAKVALSNAQEAVRRAETVLAESLEAKRCAEHHFESASYMKRTTERTLSYTSEHQRNAEALLVKMMQKKAAVGPA